MPMCFVVVGPLAPDYWLVVAQNLLWHFQEDHKDILNSEQSTKKGNLYRKALCVGVLF